MVNFAPATLSGITNTTADRSSNQLTQMARAIENHADSIHNYCVALEIICDELGLPVSPSNNTFDTVSPISGLLPQLNNSISRLPPVSERLDAAINRIKQLVGE